MTTLAKCAETRAYTPPDDPTTGAVISVTDTARDPGTRKDPPDWSTGLWSNYTNMIQTDILY